MFESSINFIIKTNKNVDHDIETKHNFSQPKFDNANLGEKKEKHTIFMNYEIHNYY